MLNKIFNFTNICGAVAFLAMLMIPAAVEGEAYLTAGVLTAGLALSAYLGTREAGAGPGEGRSRKEGRKRR